MTAFRAPVLALALTGLAASCGNDDGLAAFDDADTMMDSCAEADIGFEPDSAALSREAEDALFSVVDQVGIDCEGASIDIVAFSEEAGDQIAYARTATVENAIVTHYDISETRIAKKTEEAPSMALSDHVRVTLMVEVPVVDE